MVRYDSYYATIRALLSAVHEWCWRARCCSARNYSPPVTSTSKASEPANFFGWAVLLVLVAIVGFVWTGPRTDVIRRADPFILQVVEDRSFIVANTYVAYDDGSTKVIKTQYSNETVPGVTVTCTPERMLRMKSSDDACQREYNKRWGFWAWSPLTATAFNSLGFAAAVMAGFCVVAGILQEVVHRRKQRAAGA